MERRRTWPSANDVLLANELIECRGPHAGGEGRLTGEAFFPLLLEHVGPGRGGRLFGLPCHSAPAFGHALAIRLRRASATPGGHYSGRGERGEDGVIGHHIAGLVMMPCESVKL